MALLKDGGGRALRRPGALMPRPGSRYPACQRPESSELHGVPPITKQEELALAEFGVGAE